VSTHKEKLLEGIKFLVVEKIDPRNLKGSGDFVVALDAVGAGDGEVVFYASGSSARMTEATTGRPADATITAIVESIEVGEKTTYTKGDS
jgi:microcompartment protein CcmK/EutM